MINLSKLIEKTHNLVKIEFYILEVLIGLHYNKIIDDKKLKGQLQSLKNGTLSKYKNTYHCSINDKWYNEEYPLNIFEDLSKLIPQTNIKFDEFVKYIQKYNNQNYNFCVNIVFGVYFKCLYDKWDPSYDCYNFNDINPFMLKDFPNINAIHYNYEHCPYCGHTITSVKKDESDYDKLNMFIHNLKKGNLSKILKFNIKNYE